MAQFQTDTKNSLIRWHYISYVIGALAIMVVAIVDDSIWFLNFVHVFCGLLWTGIDLFMGFILGPIMKALDLTVRREITSRLTPRTLFLMPTISIITGTTGWFLAMRLGLTQLNWPDFGWVAAALTLVTLMAIVGLGILTPTNVLVCIELQKEPPDLEKISRWMRRYFFLTAAQGTMQVLTILIMARFRTGI